MIYYRDGNRFFATPLSIRTMGSVAYKMARVAAGMADATWTLIPKNEWDVAAGAALVTAAGGAVLLPSGETPSFNSSDTLLPGCVATTPGLEAQIRAMIEAAGGHSNA